MPSINKLTHVAVKSAKAELGKQRMLSDGNRLYLRVRNRVDRIEKDWIFIYTPRAGAAQRKLGLGNYPTVTLEKARQKATEARTLLAEGIDPRVDREVKQGVRASAEALPESVADLFDRWHTLALSKRSDGGTEVIRGFRKDVIPTIGAVLLKDVRRGHITAVLDKVLSRNASRLANRQLSELRQMFKFGVVRDLIPSDPTYGITKKDVGGRDRERDRVLSEDEIKELKVLLPNARLTKATELAVWILLATCSRVGELSKARWSDVDINAGTWVIPADNAKNRRPHTVFLSDFAATQFNALRQVCESDVWVYPNRTNESHINLKGIVKQLRDRQRAEALEKRSAAVATLRLRGGDWVPHDLRRTGATMMASLGVMPAIIERCLNHIEQNKMTRIYQRYDFSAEQQRAWRLLGQRLELLTAQ